ncbi:MAG: branched-chain amino acid ABC transporter permease [Phycisphaerales bacterium]|jgi:branched-chain amino acid transport system permease protein|nr:branched-chain amino acid ABC transporter permease [Phycisphaerales bacterium]
MDQLIQQLINGLSVGATYALIALGYTMVYGILRLINFAHGEVYMVGAVSSYYLAEWSMGWTHSLWVSLPIVVVGSMVTCAILGFLIEFLAYRPLRDRPRLVVLISAIGVSLLLQNLAQFQAIFGPTPKRFPELIQSTPVLYNAAHTIVLTNLDILSLGLSLGLMVIMTWVVLGTKTGLALRAVSFRFDISMLMGINTGKIISFTFMFGSALAAVAGTIDAIRYDVRPLMGLMPGLKAFVAAVLGGIGSIPGAVVGGLLMGLSETLVKGYLPSAYTGYADAVAFVVLIVILLVRPTGLFGRVAPEKV